MKFGYCGFSKGRGCVKRCEKNEKKKKTVEPGGVPVEVWKVLESVGIDWLTKFFDTVLVEGKIPKS